MVLIHQQSHQGWIILLQGPPVTETSHWLTGGLYCVLLRKLGAVVASYLGAALNPPPELSLRSPVFFILTVFPLVPPKMSMVSKDTHKML